MNNVENELDAYKNPEYENILELKSTRNRDLVSKEDSLKSVQIKVETSTTTTTTSGLLSNVRPIINHRNRKCLSVYFYKTLLLTIKSMSAVNLVTDSPSARRILKFRASFQSTKLD